jgi:hypothetical protein
MRFIYKILIGLLIFNSMLIFLGGFFTTSTGDPSASTNAVNITGDATIDGKSYTDKFKLENLFTFDEITGSIFGISLVVGALASWAIKSPVPIAAGIFSAFISLIYANSANIINSITPQDNWILTGLITLIGILIAIIAGFTIIEMFAGQTGADT